jgi:crotonobetaine/carnitine-CoA ligase
MTTNTSPDISRTIRELLEYRAHNAPDDIFGIENDCQITIRTAERSVNALANGLAGLGICSGNHVAVMMGNHIDHVFTFFALSKLGAVWVPVNVNLKGASLEWVIQKSAPSAIIVDAEFWKQLEPALTKSVKLLIIRNAKSETNREYLDFSKVASQVMTPPAGQPTLDDVRTIMFTSGTTGPPKGALVTERMLQTCAIGAGIASDVQPGDVFLVWEPIYHSGGAQICVLALRERITLAIVPRFSASRFWDEVKRYGVTKIHYLGGVIDILLKSAPSQKDREHTVSIAFGGGCSPQNWRGFEKRFGIPVHEVYGLTEGSGFSTFNASGKVGSVGKPLPYMEVQIVDDIGNPLPAGQIGEIIVRGKEPGLITKGYLGNPEATASALKGEWLHTGDLGRFDDDGDLFYLGRKTDSIRHRGENVSAWEVEHVLDSHPAIQESAVVGVKAEIGEQEIKAFIKLARGATLDPLDLVKWCEPRMPRYQIPRYITFVETFEKTGTLRIRKGALSKDTTDCWDLEQSGHNPKRA